MCGIGGGVNIGGGIGARQGRVVRRSVDVRGGMSVRGDMSVRDGQGWYERQGTYECQGKGCGSWQFCACVSGRGGAKRAGKSGAGGQQSRQKDKTSLNREAKRET